MDENPYKSPESPPSQNTRDAEGSRFVWWVAMTGCLLFTVISAGFGVMSFSYYSKPSGGGDIEKWLQPTIVFVHIFMSILFAAFSFRFYCMRNRPAHREAH